MSNTLSSKLDPKQAQIIARMKDQIIVAMIEKLGGEVRFNAQQLDDTGSKQLIMQADQNSNELVFRTAHVKGNKQK
jgi:hypothetical protein